MAERKSNRDPAETRAIIRDLRARFIPAETEAAAQAAFARALSRPPEPDVFTADEQAEAAEILAAIRARYPVGHA